MKAFARFTAVAFIILGLALLVGAWIFLVANSGPGITVSDGAPRQTFPASITEKVIAAAAALQGLFLCAIGEVLWLFADVADDTSVLRKSGISRVYPTNACH